MEIIYGITGMAVGAGAMLLLYLRSQRTQYQLQQQYFVGEERTRLLSQEHESVKVQLELIRKENIDLVRQLEKSRAGFEALQEKLTLHEAETQEIRKKFTLEFENIAGRLLRQNSQDFAATSQKNMHEILSPLKEKIQLFEKKVEDTYQQGVRDQTDLRAELKKLHDLNSRISDEANNLSKALKGDVKMHGNWGEVVLERVLERSGLIEGPEGYVKQYAATGNNGNRIRPDVVVYLPGKKHIVVDSKVSLVAYERAVNAETEEERLAAVKDHVSSIKRHINNLAAKHYQSAGNFNSPDFVLLFMPVESSFGLAVREDHDLFTLAWDQKVVIVGPSTLLATLRTIESIWKQENQTRNAQEIARQSGALYDKFAGFVADMECIGKNLDTTRKTYDAAMNKLATGQGNLIRRAENIKKLGAKVTKELPAEALDEI